MWAGMIGGVELLLNIRPALIKTKIYARINDFSPPEFVVAGPYYYYYIFPSIDRSIQHNNMLI